MVKIMTNLEKLFNSNPQQICACPLCGHPEAYTEMPNGFAWRVYCPNCGRYDFSHYATSNHELLDHIENDTAFRLKLSTQLRERENKEVVYFIASTSYPSGLVYPLEDASTNLEE